MRDRRQRHFGSRGAARAFVAFFLPAVIAACASQPTLPSRDHAPRDTSTLGRRSYRVIGRADVRNPDAPVLAWPGTMVSANVTGSRVVAHLLERPGPDGVSLFEVLVDGVPERAPRLLREGRNDVEIAIPEGGAHRVDLVKRTEASAGTTTFLGFDGATFGEAPPPRRRSIEIVGDSNAAGYGVDGDGPSCRFSTATENVLHAYAWLVGRALDAEVTALAYSGKGIFQNYVREDPLTLGKLYPRANPMDASSVAPPPRADAVILFAGGNDYAAPTPGKNDAPDDRQFVDAYVALLAQIRAAHAGAPIVCVVTPAVDDAPPDHVRTTLESNVRAAILTFADSRVFFVAPAQAEKSELTGCDYHPNQALQARLAITIANAVKDALYVTDAADAANAAGATIRR